MHPQLQWLSPSPLWDELSRRQDRTAFRRPAILRFATDGFMDELQSVLRDGPAGLGRFVARGETWERPAVGLPSADAAPDALPLKLFQPIHARFYLVAAALACRVPGLADHEVKAAQGERVMFVLRQLRPRTGFERADCRTYDPTRCEEQAWIVSGAVGGWRTVGAPGLVPDEERIPMFPSYFGQGTARRRLLGGVVPTGRREAYVSARDLHEEGAVAPEDPRAILLLSKVVAPWASLLEWWSGLTAAQKADANFVDSASRTSALILLDLANYMATHVPSVWQAITDSTQAADLAGASRTLYDALGSSLRQALVNAKAAEDGLEASPATDPFPPAGYTIFRLTDLPAVGPTGLETQIEAALSSAPPEQLSGGPLPPQKKAANPQGDSWFIVRCVYERPACGPNAVPVMSEPSQPFLLGSFFDAEAPARRVQVALPVDTSPAALRKFDKGVAFLISDELGKQMSRIQGLSDMVDGTPQQPGADVGMMCSFSIPIITICAMMLLMVIMKALNLVFFWIPFFKICFPVPLKGKA